MTYKVFAGNVLRALLLFLLPSCYISSFAQSESSSIALTPMVSDEIGLPSAAKNTLQQKLTQMALQNGIAAKDGDFVLTASFTVIDDLVVPSDVAQYVVKLEVMFYVVNLIEDIIMAENSCVVKGYGSSRDKAFLKAFNAINPRSPEALALTSEAKENIVKYYEDRSEILISKSQSLAKTGHYSEALAVLNPVPDCVPGYKEISALMDDIFAQWIDTEAVSYISAAKKQISLGNYEEAYNNLLSVNPLSSKFKEAENLSAEIDRRILAAEKAAEQAKILEQESAVAIANANAAKANADAANAQVVISQAQADAIRTLSGKMDKLYDDAQKAIIDQAFKSEKQSQYVSQSVATQGPQQTMQEKMESLKKFLLGKMYKA